jgi:WD40 repeat protein
VERQQRAKEREFTGSENALNAVAVSKNNVLVAAGGADKTVRLYNFADAKQLGAFKVPGGVRGLAFSPNNLTLAAACDDKPLIVTWNVPYTPNQPVTAAFGKPLQTFAHAGAVTDVVIAGDNVTVWSGDLDKTVRAWKVASEAPVMNFPHPREVLSVAFNPQGTLVATGCGDGQVRLFDLAKKAQLRQIAAHAKPPDTAIYGVSWSPDGKQVVTASIDNSLKLFNAETGALIREFKAYKVKDFEKGHQDSVFCVAFSPDGKYLASGSAAFERIIKIWNVADGTVVRDLVNPKLKPKNPMDPKVSHPGAIYSLRFSSDGKTLVSAGMASQNKGYLAVWQAADGKLLYGEELALGPFYSVALSPDGQQLALGCGPFGRSTPELNRAYVVKMPSTSGK